MQLDPAAGGPEKPEFWPAWECGGGFAIYSYPRPHAPFLFSVTTQSCHRQFSEVLPLSPQDSKAELSLAPQGYCGA